MKKLLGVTLGIMTALGGFVDLGQIVFTTQAGALFGYRLVWSIVLAQRRSLFAWKCADVWRLSPGSLYSQSFAGVLVFG